MQTLTRKTYNLPADLVAKFEKHVARGKRGAVLGEAMAQWLEEKRRADLRAAVEEGLADKENEALYLEIEREWSPASDELWAQLPDEDWPEPAVAFPEGYAALESRKTQGTDTSPRLTMAEKLAAFDEWEKEIQSLPDYRAAAGLPPLGDTSRSAEPDLYGYSEREAAQL